MNKAREPRVGIFWLFRGRLIVDSTPVSQGEPYADHIGHATGHIDYWTGLQERGVVPKEVEYEEFPRGRVIYDPKAERYTLLADKCILSRPAIVKEILRELHLPKNTMLDTDFHYRCSVCQYGTHDDDDDE